MSPHRRQDHSELCNECRLATQSACARCALPLCAEHMPSEDARCLTCEEDFLKATRVERRVIDANKRGETYTGARRPFVFLPFGVIGLLIAVVSLPVAAGIVGAGLLTTRLVPPTVPAAKIRYALKRRRFLRKVKWQAKKLAARRAKLLGPGHDGQTDGP